MTTQENKQKVDIFAEIGEKTQQSRDATLVIPQPPELPIISLPINGNNLKAAFKPQPKIETAAQLKSELEKQKRKYAKFMQNLAPKFEDTRNRLHLNQFDWRIQQRQDLNDFSRVLLGKGNWEKVDIPHYGAPLGRAVTYYRTTFNITKPMLAKGALILCFKGVDYKTHAFINGAYIGSHEGFFAPFEFDFIHVARQGSNTVVVKVENDAICMGNDSWGNDGYKYEGEKMYAATGPGYDDPELGWHHCPPGMGIYQDVFVEARSQVHIKDVFVRPILNENKAEIWVEINNCGTLKAENLSLIFAIFGQNFKANVFKNHKIKIDYAGPNVNLYRISFKIPHPRKWELDNPWLYQVQVKLTDASGNELDIACRQFGMRSFQMDEKNEPKGRLYFNNRQIRLRGANTMGYMQQCVMKKDLPKLRDAILLAKICNMNFFRLTQRPVQPEIYDYCDKLGMMTQTDLPLFAVLRRNQFCEAVKQSQEMERLVRNHPCNIINSYMNEPFPNGWDKPHRNLIRKELEDFFVAATKAVLLENPDRIIKPVDGDYDPPTWGLPDNHCYCGWYIGHGLDMGRLNKGYWQKVKPGWFYGCGEFGTEGLDFVNTMRKYYPKKWLPQNLKEESTWSPNRIIQAQTGRFHYNWFDTQTTLENWSRVSQKHQEWATRLMTEAFRRDSRMYSFAIHLFIDAFPSGWMKSIIDFKCQPKPAYFAYREALTPLMANIRTDRYKYFSGEQANLEAWICNDLPKAPDNCYLHYQLEIDNKVIFAQKHKASIPVCESKFQGFMNFKLPIVKERKPAIVRLGLSTKSGRVLHDTSIVIELFPTLGSVNHTALIIGSNKGKAARLAEELGLKKIFPKDIKHSDIILIDDYALFVKKQKFITNAVKQGATAVFIELPEGQFRIAGRKVNVEICGMGPRHFVSRNTNHDLVKGFEPNDFKFWHNANAGFVTPILETTFTAQDFVPIITSANGKWEESVVRKDWVKTFAVAEKRFGMGVFRVCQLSLTGRLGSNPTAGIFARRLLGLD